MLGLFSSDLNFPSQKKGIGSKDKKWAKRCINAGEALAIWKDPTLEQSYKNRVINYNLYSDILDQDDIERTCNPHNIKGLNAPAKMQNHPIANNRIDLLVGESIHRKFDYTVRLANPDAISEKEQSLKREFEKLLTSHLMKLKDGLDEETIKKELEQFNKYKNYSFQDIREASCNHILKYLFEHLNLNYTFSKGFKDALIGAKEVYSTDIVSGEPILKRLNPLNVFAVRSGESPYIEDADIIVIVNYMSVGQIIDEYYEELTPKQIDDLEARISRSSDDHIGSYPDSTIHPQALPLSYLQSDFNSYTSKYNSDGNIRVTKVYWKSLRKIKKVKYYDEFGDVQYDIYDEKYKIDTSLGEEEEILWINEWWEGHKIGGGIDTDDSDSIYLKIRPKPIQFRSLENISKCHPGIVGTIYNTNDNDGKSLMDRMKPYQYLYNVLAYNTQLMIAKNKGKIMRLNLAEIPSNWKIEQWLSFAFSTNVAPYDPFNEVNKGQMQGKAAGGLPAQAPVIDMEMGNSIQMYMNLMQYIEMEMGKISGVSDGRLGQIQAREAVNNVNREVTQSSHITEYLFLEHEFTKLRALKCLLDTAIFAWTDLENKKVQYILDDGSTAMLNIDMKNIASSEYGLHLSNNRNTPELIGALKQLSHAGVQNGLLSFSDLIDIYTMNSISSIRNKIEKKEIEKAQKEQMLEEQKLQLQQEQIQAVREKQDQDIALQREEWDREDIRADKDNQVKLEIEQIKNKEFIDDSKIKDLELKERQLEETIRHNIEQEKQNSYKKDK